MNGASGLLAWNTGVYEPWMAPYGMQSAEPLKGTRKIYLIGSLRNSNVPDIAASLRQAGHIVYDDWYAAGPEADDYWQRYEQQRGHDFRTALQGWASYHVFYNDKQHLDESDTGVLVLPAGKSGHLELGYMIGQGKQCYILLAGEPERFDVMYRFATGVAYNISDLVKLLEG